MDDKDAKAISFWLKEMAKRNEWGVLELPQGFLSIRPIHNWSGIDEISGREVYRYDFQGYDVFLSHELIIRREKDIEEIIDKTLKYLTS